VAAVAVAATTSVVAVGTTGVLLRQNQVRTAVPLA